MVTIQEYANKKGISYEAVRKQLKRYEKELKGHVSKQNRKTFLDDQAVAFLDDKREKSPIIILQESKNEELQETRQALEDMKQAFMEVQRQLTESQKKIIELTEEKTALIEERGKNQLLLELKEQTDKELEETKQRLSDAESELKSYHKTFFGLYRKL